MATGVQREASHTRQRGALVSGLADEDNADTKSHAGKFQSKGECRWIGPALAQLLGARMRHTAPPAIWGSLPR